MSGYKIHLLAYGLFAWIITSALIKLGFAIKPGAEFLISILVGLVYCLLPDIDTPSSKMREYVDKVLLFSCLACILAFALGLRDYSLLYASALAVAFMYALWYTRHRGIFHTWYAGVVLSLPWWFFSPLYSLFALIGFLSHLIVDGKML